MRQPPWHLRIVDRIGGWCTRRMNNWRRAEWERLKRQPGVTVTSYYPDGSRRGLAAHATTGITTNR